MPAEKPSNANADPDPDVASMSDQERFNKQVDAAQKARAAQATAASWKEKAMKCLDSKERYRMLQNAYDSEVEAHGHSKFARRLQSGPWQGGAAGAGIGAGVAAGLGTVVGTLVGGLVSVPTAAVGGLTGIAAGAVHGPWFHFDNHKKTDEMRNEEVMDEARKLDKAVEEGEREPVPPPKMEEGGEGAAASPAKRKPRKLDNRSANVGAAGAAPAERKKPRKLETRSQAEKKENAV